MTRALGTLLLAALILLLGARGFGWAHSWYDTECCSGQDCAPSAATPVEELADGYHLMGQVVPYGDRRIRVSPDKDFHICSSAGSRQPGAWIICLYVPGRGV